MAGRFHLATGAPLHKPSGLPMYRVDEIPEHLDTVTGLRRVRRRPAEGQMPAAVLFYHGNKHTNLFVIADAEPMAPLSPKREAAYLAARTCYRCAVVAIDPLYRRGPARVRCCRPCSEAEETARTRAGMLPGRIAATLWARSVLSDPSVVLVADGVDLDNVSALGVHVEDLAGDVLLSAIVHNRRGAGPADVVPPVVPPAEIADRVDALLTRRWVGIHGAMSAAWWVSRSLDVDPWVGLPEVDGVETQVRAWLAGGWVAVRVPLWPTSATVATVRSLITRMAEDTDHPHGPAVCPVLPDTGRIACSLPAPCAEHTNTEGGAR